MRICVVGAGAMGALYGSMFQAAGNEVVFLDPSLAIVDAINADGATITRPDGHVDTYPIAAAADARSLGGAFDLVLFQVKGFATAIAAQDARPLVGPETIVLTLQNGLGNVDVLRAAFPDNPVVHGISLHSASMPEPGRYLHTGTRGTSLGPSREDWFPLAERVAGALDGGGYGVGLHHESDIGHAIYAKWVLNCGSLPTLAMTGLATDAVSAHEIVLRVCDGLTREACELAALEGVELDAEERVAFNRQLFRTAGGKASMLQDIEAGRRTEIDTITGAAVRLADAHHHPAPLSRTMLALIKGREAAMGLRP